MHTRTLNFNGTDSFTYTVKDSATPAAVSNLATVTVTVTAVNDPQVAVSDTATTAEDTAVNISVRANDTDPDVGDTLTVNSVTQGTNGTVAINADGTVKYTPNLNFNGTDSFTYTVKDSATPAAVSNVATVTRSEEHTSELQSLAYLACRLLLEKTDNINVRANDS